MMYRLLLPVVLCASLLCLSSCSDPTGVGADLGGNSLEEGTPKVFPIVPSTLDTVSVPSETGFTAVPGATNRSWRFLTGTVKDPIAGVIEAQGYVDFLGAASRPSSVAAASVDSLDAELRFQPTYLHGDTLSTVDVNLFALASEAEMDRAPADTSFSAGPQIGTTYSITPTDSLLTLSLPDAWIRDHLDAIQNDTTFRDAINGFKIAASNPPSTADRKVIVGFSQSTAVLRITTSTDTVDFTALKSFTHIDRRGDAEDSYPDRVRLQDGVGTGLSMAWEFNQPLFADTLKNSRLNQADVTVPIDADAMEASRPSDFVRPSVTGYRVFAKRAEGAPGCDQLVLPQRQDQAGTCILPTDPALAPDAAQVASEASFTIFDQVLSRQDTLETIFFTSFRVEIAVRQNGNATTQNTLQRGLPSSLPVLVRTASAETEDLPRATLVVTPL